MPIPETVNVPVDEIRDYHRVNALVASLLDRGHTRLCLRGVSGQRLLVSGLHGDWRALIEIHGPAGPEVGAGLDAPGLLVVALRDADVAAGRCLRDGRLVVCGRAGDLLGYRQEGGLVMALGPAGHRAGLEQRSGLLVLRGSAGRLVGERQRGGQIVALDADIGPHAGRGRVAGDFRRPGEPLPESIRGSIDGTLDELRTVVGIGG